MLQDLIAKLSNLTNRISRLESQEKALPTTGMDFPTESLYQGRPFLRIDRGITYFYDLANTRWQSELFSIPFIQRGALPTSASGNYEALLPAPYFSYGSGTLIEALHWKFIALSTPQSVSNYYSVSNIFGVSLTGTTSGLTLTSGTTNTQTTPQSLWYGYINTINSILGTNFDHVELGFTATGTPGSILFYANLSIRFIN